MREEFSVSKKELRRRKNAFWALSVSLLIGLLTASVIFDSPIPGWMYICVVAILAAANISIRRFFAAFLSTKVGLSKYGLVRTSGASFEKYLIKNIKEIKIKRTTRNTVREIYIYLKDGKSIFINGLKGFEKFEMKLLKKVNRDVMIKRIREPIDFDSIYFYPVLGLTLSMGTVYFWKVLSGLSYQAIKIFTYASFIYGLLVVIYFINSKPIFKRYGRVKNIID